LRTTVIVSNWKLTNMLYKSLNLKTIRINNLSLPDMTLISTDNNKTKEIVKMFYNVSWKKGIENTGTLFHPSRNLWKWRAFWYREPLYQDENKTTVSVELPHNYKSVMWTVLWFASISLVKIKHITKTYFDKQHDHIMWRWSDWFCPRIQNIKQTIEEIFDTLLNLPISWS
jgi:hypothetical protein